MPRTITLEQALADFAEEAAVLRRNGHVAQAETIARVCDTVRETSLDYITWITESEAKLRSGRGDDWFRARRRVWAEDGLAEQRGRHWYYRRCIVERRKLAAITRAEARLGRKAS